MSAGPVWSPGVGARVQEPRPLHPEHLTIYRASLLHKKAICAVHSLLCSHDADPRYAEATVKARVAELYLPLLSLARDTLPRLHDFAGQQGRVGRSRFHHLGT